jgi:cytoskeletal protein RodZ
MAETIGQQLKAAREAHPLTIGKVAQATHIQARFIEAMEADDFDSLPSPVQARAFLHLYSEFLGLSLDDLIARQRLDAGQPPAAFLNKEPVPVPDQVPGEVPGDTEVAGPVDKPSANRSLHIHEKIKGFLPRNRQTLPQQKKASKPPKPTPPIVPGHPELGADTQAEVIESPGEEPTPDWQEESLSSERPSSEHQESQRIFTVIGVSLRQRRESLSLTLDEIERHTHVRKHYLEALERGNFDHLPSSVQARGMLYNYAHFLDMDVDAILSQFAEGLQVQRLERQPAPVEKPRSAGAKIASRVNLPPGLQRYLSMDILVGGGLILILLVFAIWGTSRVVGLRSATTPQTTVQSISDILVVSSGAGTLTLTPTVTGTAAVIPTAIVTAIGTIPTSGPGPVQIVIVALQQAYLRVTVDGTIQFDGRLTIGTAYSFSGNTQIEVLTGNGAGVSILFNQSDLGPLGRFGEVVDRIYTANAILNPASTTTPTSTITLTPTVTPRISPTPTLTSTPLAPPVTP